jgi:hypothetical protein
MCFEASVDALKLYVCLFLMYPGNFKPEDHIVENLLLNDENHV